MVRKKFNVILFKNRLTDFHETSSTGGQTTVLQPFLFSKHSPPANAKRLHRATLI